MGSMNFVPTHLDVPPDIRLSDHIFFLPGSPDRARRLASHFQDAHTYPSKRGHDVHLGILPGTDDPIPVGCVSSGMGCPSLGIVVTELVELGVRRILRVGSAGALQPRVEVGHVVIATGSVRDEHASNAFAPSEFPAVAGQRTTRALEDAARACLDPGTFHLGVVHSKDSLHGREFGAGPLAEENEHYMRLLAELGCLASEMEASHLFVLAHALASKTESAPEGEAPIEAGCVLAILGGVAGSSTQEARERAEERAIEVALEAARLLHAPRE